MIKIPDGFKDECFINIPSSIIETIKDNPLAQDLYITLVGFFPRVKYHYRHRPEGAEHYIYIHCTKGCGWYEINGVRHEVRENDYFILPPNKEHRYGADDDDPWTIYWIHFAGNKAKYFWERLSATANIAEEGSTSRIQYRIGLFNEIITAMEQAYIIDNVTYACQLLNHLLASVCFINQFRHMVSKNVNENKIISNAIYYMNESLHKKVKLEDIAERLNISPMYLSIYFKKHTGISPITYLNNIKMNHACKLMETTNMKINDISKIVGIDDPYYFSRLFSKIMGVSPSYYKKRSINISEK